MAAVVYSGAGAVKSTDFKTVKWVGQTKGGKSVTIEITNAICISNIDLTFAEKDDVVPEIEFEGCYVDGTGTEPWSITVEDGVSAGNGEIVLGAGLFYIGTNLVGLTRGGGKFVREVELREINADDDKGKYKDRVVLDGARPKLTMHMLQWLTRVSDMYVGVDQA